jgi:S-DNA-T family DNA segregation ATPase FtsK/SpoIIIE
VDGWPGLADNVGLPGSRIVSVVVDTWRWTARVILRKGTTAEQAIAQVPAIESALGARKGSIRVIPDDGHAGTVFMRVTETDPHADAIPWPGVAARSIAAPVDLGVCDDGRTVSALLLRRNVLIGGTTGSGKSGILSVFIAALAACPDVVLWGVDLKGGMELQPWASCLDRLATTPHEACVLFRDAVGWLNRRAREKAAQGSRVLDPTPDDPALVIIVDEYAELPDEAHDCADSLARRGRAVAVNLIAATQKPTQAAMGRDTAARSQMDVRIALRVRERRDTDLIIGQGSLNAGWNPHALTRPGEFLISRPEYSVPDRNRAYLITDDQIIRHAAAWAGNRPMLPDGGPDTPDTPEPEPARDDWHAEPPDGEGGGPEPEAESRP